MLMNNFGAALIALIILLLFLWPRDKGECSPPPKRYKAGCGCNECECQPTKEKQK